MLKIIFMSYVTFVIVLLQSILKEVTSNFKVSICPHSTVFTEATHLKSMVKMSVPTLPNCITTLEGSDSVTIWKFFTEAWKTIRISIW